MPAFFFLFPKIKQTQLYVNTFLKIINFYTKHGLHPYTQHTQNAHTNSFLQDTQIYLHMDIDKNTLLWISVSQNRNNLKQP